MRRRMLPNINSLNSVLRSVRFASPIKCANTTRVLCGTMFVEWELARYDGVPRGWPLPDPDEPADVCTVDVRCVRNVRSFAPSRIARLRGKR